MRVNLYLPDEERDLYEKAKRLLESEGRSISRFFMDCLKDYVKSKEGKSKTVIERKVTIEPFDVIAQENIKALLPKGYEIEVVPLEDDYKPMWVIASPTGKYISALDYKLRYYPKRLIDLVKRLRKSLLENNIPFLTVVIFNETDVKTNSLKPRIEKIAIFDLKKMREYLLVRNDSSLMSEETQELFKKLFGDKA